MATALAGAQAAPPSDKLPPDTVVASQGSAVVTIADIDAFAQRIDEKQRPGFFDNPKRLDSLITNLLVERQLAAEAEKAGVDKEPGVQAQLKLSREEILSAAHVKDLRASVKLPDFDQLAREEYLGHKEKYVRPGKLDVEHILISTEKHSDADAKKLADQVRQEAAAHPDQFDALVEKYSEDPSKDQNHGLMTDANNKQRYVPQFSAAASALKIPGEISEPVRTKFGYHILKLVTRTSDAPQKFESVKADIVEQLRQSYIDKTVSKHTDEIRNQHMEANAAAIASLRDRYGKVQTPEEAQATTPKAAPAPSH
jgi:peptidyl-prolyl cis-trans isomerase C